VSLTWGDLNARARGLGTHLLSPARIVTLAGSADLRALADAMRTSGFELANDVESSAEDLELAVRRFAAAALRTLERWYGGRADALAVVLEDLDRRSLRAMLRGAAQGAAAPLRLAGAVPTPSLPERALAELARQPTVSGFAALLTAWKHPYGSALFPEAASAHPDLFRLELVLNRTWAARSLRSARRGGRVGPLIEFVRLTIDVENALTALVFAGAGRAEAPKDGFLPGGLVLPITAFEHAVTTGDAPACAARLAVAFGKTPLAAALRGGAHDLVGLEASLLEAQIAMLRDEQRRDPLGAGSVLLFVLRLRAQVAELRRIIWGIALSAPETARRAHAGVA
jgi:vacuolar-type H+-ATPase subunit C/Vma6